MIKTDYIANEFINKFINNEFVNGRGGVKMLEIIGASFIADKPSIFGKVNEEYVSKEIEWYESGSTNVNDLSDEVPLAWKATANKHGEINSNYGKLIYSEKFYNQFNEVLAELVLNKDSRRATMIYTRPSIWAEYKENGKNDFICTNAVTYYIRNDRVDAVVQMRSNDVVYGYKNDYAWQKHVLNKLVEKLNCFMSENTLFPGVIYWQVQNLHVYEKHFELVKKAHEEKIKDSSPPKPVLPLPVNSPVVWPAPIKPHPSDIWKQTFETPRCQKCGLELKSPMGYVCPDLYCPTFQKAIF